MTMLADLRVLLGHLEAAEEAMKGTAARHRYAATVSEEQWMAEVERSLELLARKVANYLREREQRALVVWKDQSKEEG